MILANVLPSHLHAYFTITAADGTSESVTVRMTRYVEHQPAGPGPYTVAVALAESEGAPSTPDYHTYNDIEADAMILLGAQFGVLLPGPF